MRTMTGGRWPGIVLAVLLLSACSREKRETVAEAPSGPAPVATPVAAPTPALPPEAPVPPETLAAVDTALAAAKAFNAKALSDLAAIEKAERRVRDQATRALEAARRGDATRVTAARADAEAAHKTLVDGLALFRTTATDQQTAVAAAMALCAPAADPLAPATPAPKPAAQATPAPTGAPATAVPATGLAASAGCLALPAEQALLAQNIEAVSARYQAAEAAYRQDRPKLEEAAATLALGR